MSLLEREGHDNGAWRFISRMPHGAPEQQGENKKPPASSVVSRRCRRPWLGDQRAKSSPTPQTWILWHKQIPGRPTALPASSGI